MIAADKGRVPAWSGRRPVVVAVLIQLALVVVVHGVLRAMVPTLESVSLYAVHALGAAGLSGLLRLGRGWIAFQAALPVLAGLSAQAVVPSWMYLAAFVVLVLVQWNSARDRVPLFLTNRTTVQALQMLLPAGQGWQFIDLGCGVGSVLHRLAARNPRGRFIGIESAPIPFALAWARARLGRCANLRVIYGDMWRHDLASYDVVYAFLSPAPMARLYAKVSAEQRPGGMFVSNSFAVPGIAPGEIVEVPDQRRTRLLLWRSPAAAGSLDAG